MIPRMKAIQTIVTILLTVMIQVKKKMISCQLAKSNKKSIKEQKIARIW